MFVQKFGLNILREALDSIMMTVELESDANVQNVGLYS